MTKEAKSLPSGQTVRSNRAVRERDKVYVEVGILVHTEVRKDFPMKVTGKQNPEGR